MNRRAFGVMIAAAAVTVAVIRNRDPQDARIKPAAFWLAVASGAWVLTA